MIRSSRPAVDHRLFSTLGTTRDGQPLSYNRAPAADLAGWIARLSVTRLELAPGYELACGLFGDTAAIRIQPRADLTIAPLADPPQRYGKSALFWGSQTRLMPLEVHGSLVSIGIAVRPSAFFALMGNEAADYVDKVVELDPPNSARLQAALAPDALPEEWLRGVEGVLRDIAAERGGIVPEPVTAGFEEIAFLDPGMPIAQAARELDVDRRRLERLVVRDFGMPPKQVLKRARALDMASHLRGVADRDEADAMSLRYYDESHLIREFIALFGMSPRQFTKQPLPLLTLTLEARQARRLEMINRLAPGAKRPWQA